MDFTHSTREWLILFSIITVIYAGYRLYIWQMHRTISKWENVLSFIGTVILILLWIVFWF